MSPLARSLLALIVLLAAVDAIPSPSCAGVLLGPGASRGPYNTTRQIKENNQPSGTIYIPDKCRESGKRLLSQSVDACSKGGSAPYITAVGSRYSPVIITCPEDAGGCPVIELLVLQFCADNKGPYY
ncbi:uncharacterized protein LOC125227580 [Leguminivora glycinivorella]|uniref:uncharacterized protein LOC125227580 n=1 Tax=Leguminivora glycinivorella TaxID=1035111 RepID=UPI00200EA574|nr:uncharacterized protein LOC125227580 [Leguminivora glycinivorella]